MALRPISVGAVGTGLLTLLVSGLVGGAQAGLTGERVATPSCPSAASGWQTDTQADPNGGHLFLSGNGGASFTCDYAPTSHPSFGGGSVYVNWVLPNSQPPGGSPGCGHATGSASYLPSQEYWAAAGWQGNMDATAGKAMADQFLASAPSFARSCKASAPAITTPTGEPEPKPISSKSGATAMTFDTMHKEFESNMGFRWCESYYPATHASYDCHVKVGATITFCNKQNFDEKLFSLSKGNAFPDKTLRTGQCFSIKIKAAPSGTVKIYSAIHSQMRLVLFVIP